MKKAIVLGATSGIGKEVALILANQNYIVGISGRRKNLLDNLVTHNPHQFIPLEIDITDTKSIANKLQTLTQQLGGLDLLFLSSGTGELNENLQFHIDEPTLHTNILGFTSVVNWAYTYFEQQQKGHLVVITSVGGIRGSRLAPAYNASKAYQINYIEGLHQKNTKNKAPIYITEIRAGLVDTAMAKGEGLFWVAQVRKAAQQIFSAVQKKRKRVYVTRRWRIIGGLLKILPPYLYRKL